MLKVMMEELVLVSGRGVLAIVNLGDELCDPDHTGFFIGSLSGGNQKFAEEFE